MPKATDKDEALKRLGGGRWQTRDERFTIEPQSGTWVVVDSEQTDELGLALVRGPFGSLGAAKEAIAAARDEEPAPSPLATRAEGLRDRPERLEDVHRGADEARCLVIGRIWQGSQSGEAGQGAEGRPAGTTDRASLDPGPRCSGASPGQPADRPAHGSRRTRRRGHRPSRYRR